MPRKPHYYLPGVPCHVIQRGYNREPCFSAPDDFRYYLQCLREATLKYEAGVKGVGVNKKILITPTPFRYGPDWGDNASQALFGASAQYDYAKELAQQVADRLQARYPDAELLLAGHSLGGGLAAAAAYKISGSAITFNAAGVHAFSRWFSGKPKEIRAHYIPGDSLSAQQDYPPFSLMLPSVPGMRIAHPFDCENASLIERHSLDSFELFVASYCVARSGSEGAPAVCHPSPTGDTHFDPAPPNLNGLPMYESRLGHPYSSLTAVLRHMRSINRPIGLRS